ncbi:YIP1 family protein [Paenibacillus sp. Leaf72]|uniref:YIP1 family protein n=1 Tax=Paenibacillus sp. Leaf72 TaxID=1736234 RepID=UPI000A484DDE|nr:YIP1 family protein [Paenibacillus sp. Leaf72]
MMQQGNWKYWFRVWIHPRQTVRHFLKHPGPFWPLVVIALFSGIFQFLDTGADNSWGNHIYLGLILLLAVLVGAPLGIGGLFLSGVLYKWVGSWFGGTATRHQMYIAFARGVLAPSVLIGLLWIPQFVLLGRGSFTDTLVYSGGLASGLDLPGGVLMTLSLLFAIIKIVLSIWVFIIMLHAVGEAHQFSAWRALGVSLIITVAIIVLVMILVLPFLVIGIIAN